MDIRKLLYFQSPQYYYSPSHRGYILFLKKTPKTVTDEDRNLIFNPEFAKYQGDNLILEKIISVKEPDKKIDFLEPDNKIGKIKKNIIFFKNIEPCLSFCSVKISNGVLRKWDFSGKLLSQESFNNNLKHGKQFNYFDDILLVKEYYNGIIHGICQDLENEIISTKNFHYGVLHGTISSSGLNGKIIFLKKYFYGSLLEETHYESDVIINQVNYNNNLYNNFNPNLITEQGKFKISLEENLKNTLKSNVEYFYPDDKISEECYYHKGVKHGRSIKYYNDGKISWLGHFDAGILNGRSFIFDNSGNLISDLKYNLGKEV